MADPTYDYPIENDDRQWQKVICNLCGSIVESEEQHTAWHNDLDKRIRLSSIGYGGVPFFGGGVRE